MVWLIEIYGVVVYAAERFHHDDGITKCDAPKETIMYSKLKLIILSAKGSKTLHLF